MTGCIFFHILGIWSSYAEDSTFLITRNNPALLKASFLAKWSALMFELSTYTRFPSLYSMASPLDLSVLHFIILFVFFKTFSTSLLVFFIFWMNVISQTLKHVWDMFDFNITSNPCGYLALFVSKTPLVVWYFIMNLILSKVHGYFTLFESKSTVIFICVHCLIIFFKLHKFTWILYEVFPSPNLNSYVVFY